MSALQGEDRPSVPPEPDRAAVLASLADWAGFCDRSCAEGVIRTTVPPVVMRRFAIDLRLAMELLRKP